jgi:DNA-binding NtrC family response regulator
MENRGQEKRKILVVDDEEAIRELYSTLLTDEFDAREILFAESVARVKELVTFSNVKVFDVAVLDASLLDGMVWDVIEFLGSRGFIGKIVVVTGGFKKDPPSRFFDTVDVLLKKNPFPGNILISVIHSYIK